MQDYPKLNILSQTTIAEQVLEDTQSIVQLALTTLTPFQVSVEVAQLRLQDNEQKEIGWYCYIIGIGTLR